MNQLKAEIKEIEAAGEILLITLRCAGLDFSSLIIDNREQYIRKGNAVFMVFKETELAIGKNLGGSLSIRNRFPSTVQAIKKGRVLSDIRLDYQGHDIVSIITTASCENLELKPGDPVEGLLKTNELLLMCYE